MDTLGVYGKDTYDFVLHLSGIITNLGKKVLLADASSQGTLECIINAALRLDAKECALSYYGTDYFRLGAEGLEKSFERMKEEIIHAEYDMVIFLFDGPSHSARVVRPSKAIFITNQEYQNIETVSDCFRIFKQDEFPECQIVYRDIYKAVPNPEKLLRSVNTEIPNGTRHICMHDETDGALRILSGYGPNRNFGKLSAGYRRTLYKLCASLFPDCTGKEINRAMK